MEEKFIVPLTSIKQLIKMPFLFVPTLVLFGQ